MTKKFLFLTVIISEFVIYSVYAQSTNFTPVDNNGNPIDLTGKHPSAQVITTAVPFLTISPDARAGGMADVGAATSPDANAVYWNAAKLAFADKDMAASISYTPWLRKLGINDMSLSYLSGYKKLSKQEAIGVSLNYFNMGSITFTDQNGNAYQDFKPKEYAVSVTYSRKLSKYFSVAPTIKYIYSNLSGNLTIPGSTTVTRPANGAAVDLAAFYTRDTKTSGMDSKISFGAIISNVGSKMSYTTGTTKDFIPTNLKVGLSYQIQTDQYSKVIFSVDANKLMVPTPPIKVATSTSDSIVKGRDDSNAGLIGGIVGSFTDAPFGFRQELREIILSYAIEYWYNDLLAIRGGFFDENKYTGNRKYFTLGCGIRYQSFGIDFAYLLPMAQNNPLAETLRFTLHFDFKSKVRQEDILIEE
ncbi:MAG TPA: type IX secretion system outer membrane channel protein PorV [Cytophagaceae bacterium]|jgi:hypothetical protein|nr:type IX secretion system outer membrane channel protein PorV [Cytophagaceae bacterium]